MARKLSLRKADMNDPVVLAHAEMKADAQLPLDAFAFYNGLDYSQLWVQMFVFETQLLLQEKTASDRADFLMKIYLYYKKSESILSGAYTSRIKDFNEGKTIGGMENSVYVDTFQKTMRHTIGEVVERPIWSVEHLNGSWLTRIAENIKSADDYLEAERILEVSSLAL